MSLNELQVNISKGWRRAFPLLLLLVSVSACRMDSVEKPIGLKSYPAPTEYILEVPSGIPPMPLPDDNPLTVEGIELGRRLFYDPILSSDSSISCASCHKQEFAFSDGGKRWSEGVNGQIGDKNSMALINLGYYKEFFWDGRAHGLNGQAGEPVENPVEMMENWVNVVEKLQNHPEYPDYFGRAFGSDEVSKDLATKALEQFMLTLISATSPYDNRYTGDPGWTTEAFQGLALFMDEDAGDCFHCHQQPLFQDFETYHNNGLDSVFSYADENMGRYDVTLDSSDIGLFKSPTLRNIALTGPYMHDGRFVTLKEVLDQYSEHIKNSRTVDPLMTKPSRLPLTEDEKYKIIAFLEALTDTEFINDPRFSNPFE